MKCLLFALLNSGIIETRCVGFLILMISYSSISSGTKLYYKHFTKCFFPFLDSQQSEIEEEFILSKNHQKVPIPLLSY
jgi:hypothetical protein